MEYFRIILPFACVIALIFSGLFFNEKNKEKYRKNPKKYIKETKGDKGTVLLSPYFAFVFI